MTNYTVVLADDHPIVLAGVKEIVEKNSNFVVVGEAMTSSSLIASIDLHKPHVVITDFYMPGDDSYGDGMRLISFLIRKFPDVKFLVLTSLRNRSIVAGLYECGVAGVLQKNINLDKIGVALKKIATGEVYFGDFTLEPDSVAGDEFNMDERIASISVKEAEVLRLFLSGKRLKDIAVELKRSAKTVSTQKTAVMRKLCVTSDQELFAFCSENQVL